MEIISFREFAYRSYHDLPIPPGTAIRCDSPGQVEEIADIRRAGEDIQSTATLKIKLRNLADALAEPGAVLKIYSEMRWM